MTGSYAASYLPWILIPVVTWLMPIVVMGLLFVYIESDAQFSYQLLVISDSGHLITLILTFDF